MEPIRVCSRCVMDTTDPEYIKKAQFYDAVIITYTAAINFAHRYAAKALELDIPTLDFGMPAPVAAPAPAVVGAKIVTMSWSCSAGCA